MNNYSNNLPANIVKVSLTLNKKRYEFAFAFDRSGSMFGTESFVSKGFNSLINALNDSLKAKILLTAILFDDEIETLYSREPLINIEKLEYVVGGATALYDGVGSTINFIKEGHRQEKLAFDAKEDIKEQDFNLIEDENELKFNEQEEIEEKKFNLRFRGKRNYIKKIYQRKIYKREEYLAPEVHMLTYTDGMENASQFFSQESLSELVQERIEAGWKFYCFGDFALDIEMIADSMGMPKSQTIAFIRDEKGFKSMFKTINGMVKHLALHGFIPNDWQEMANSDSPLFGVKDENVKRIFNEARTYLNLNEEILAKLEAYAKENSYDNGYKKIYSKILQNINRIKIISKSLTELGYPKLVEILTLYLAKQEMVTKLIMKTVITKSSARISSANLISMGSLRNIAQRNIMKFAEFSDFYTQITTNLNEMNILVRKAEADNFYSNISDSLRNNIDFQTKELDSLIIECLEARRNYISFVINSSSNFIFNRDKDKKMGFFEIWYTKLASKTPQFGDELKDELARLCLVYKTFKLPNKLKIKLSKNKKILSLLKDEENLHSWILQVCQILGLDNFQEMLSQTQILELTDKKDISNEDIKEERPHILEKVLPQEDNK